MDHSERRAFLAKQITARMDELGFTQVDLVRASAVSDATIRRLKEGDEEAGYRRTTLAKIARALGWSPVRIVDFLETGEWADESPPAGAAALTGKVARLSPRDRAVIERLVDDMIAFGESPMGRELRRAERDIYGEDPESILADLEE